MARNDITVVSDAAPVREYKTDDRDTSGATATIKPGEPVKVGGVGSNFVKLLEDGDPEVGTDEFIGIATTESTETATVNGVVSVRPIIPGKTILRAPATTAGNVDTEAKILLLLQDWVTFDLTAGVFTIDENEGSDPNVHGLKIVSINASTGDIDVLVNGNATEASPLVGQTMD